MGKDDIDRDVMRRSYTEAVEYGGVLLSHRIGRKVRPYLLKNQIECDHVTLIVKRCIDKGHIVRVGRGQFTITDNGLTWLALDLSLPELSVAKADGL